MNRIFFQDVVPPNRRTIRDVPISGSRRKKMVLPEEEAAEEESQANIDGNFEDRTPVFPQSSRSRPRKIFALIALAVIAVFVFVMMTAFASARIDIVPKKEAVTFNLDLQARKNALPGSDEVLFEIVELKRKNQLEVRASGEELVERKASGVITIYNNSTASPQRLITRTRFESPEGLVYRIAESVTVPGKTGSAPGMIEAKVFADEAGEKYNIGKTDFTIPGFKSDAEKFKNIYAKSKTDMTGGFIGKAKIVSEEDKKTAVAKLETDLKNELNKNIGTKIPDEFVALDGAIVYEFVDLGQADSIGQNATVSLEGTAYAVVINKSHLSDAIARQYIPEWRNLRTQIRSFDSIRAELGQGFSPAVETVAIKLNGTAEVFAAVNGLEIAESLRGKPKGDLNRIMSGFEAVSSAKATVRPIWQGNFPENPAKININIQ